MTALAKELDIKPSLLYRWRKEYSGKPGTSFSGNGKVVLTEAEQEVARLKKELHETQMERDILKKYQVSGSSCLALNELSCD